MDWLTLQRAFREHYAEYVESAKQERDLLARQREVELLFHRQQRELRNKLGWVHFLVHNDVTAVERNEWDARSRIHEGVPEGGSEARFRDFALALRRAPEALALLARSTVEGMSGKARALLGRDVAEQTRQQRIACETLLLSLCGGVSLADEFARVRAVFRAAFDADVAAAAASSSVDPIAVFRPVREPTDAKAAPPQQSPSPPPPTTASPLPALHTHAHIHDDERVPRLYRLSRTLFAMCAQRQLREVLATRLQAALAEAFALPAALLDPDPVTALKEVKSAPLPSPAPASGGGGNGGNGGAAAGGGGGGGGGGHDDAPALDKPKSLLLRIGSAISSFVQPRDTPEDWQQAFAMAGGAAQPPAQHSALARRLIEERRARLLAVCDAVLGELLAPTLQWPADTLLLLGDALRVARARLGADEAARISAPLVAVMLFGAGVLPAIEQPTLCGLLAHLPVAAAARHNARVLSLLLERIVVGETFAATHYLQACNAYIAQRRDDLLRRCQQIAEVALRLVDVPSGGGGAARGGGTLCVSLREVVFFHELLLRNAGRLSKDPATQPLLAWRDLSPSGLSDEQLAAHYLVALPEEDAAAPLGEPLLRDVTRTTIQVFARRCPGDAAAATLLQLLARVLFFTDPRFLAAFVGDAQSLDEVLAALRGALESELRGSWETASTLLCLLEEVELVLQSRAQREDAQTAVAPLQDKWVEARHAALRSELQAALREMRAAHSELWTRRRAQLEHAVDLAKQSLERVRRECDAVGEAIFRHHVASVLPSTEVICRLRLPPSLRLAEERADSTGAGAGAAGGAAAGGGGGGGKGPLFYCGSAEGFVHQFRAYGGAFRAQPEVGARVLHFFLAAAEQRFKQEPAIEAAQAERAADLLEAYLEGCLFHVMFSDAERALLAAQLPRDAALHEAAQSLRWVEPAHLNLPELPPFLPLWARAIECVRALDDHVVHRSAEAKLALMTTCVKWLVKQMQSRLGGTGTDADASQSALIYVILRAAPRQLPSTMLFASTYRPVERLRGEHGYCLTQFNVAVRYITDTLTRMDPVAAPHRSLRKRPSTKPAPAAASAVVAAAAAAAASAAAAQVAPSASGPAAPVAAASSDATFDVAGRPRRSTVAGAPARLQLVLALPRVRQLIVSFCSREDLLRRVRFVSHQFSTLALDAQWAQRKIAMDPSGNLTGIDAHAPRAAAVAAAAAAAAGVVKESAPSLSLAATAAAASSAAASAPAAAAAAAAAPAAAPAAPSAASSVRLSSASAAPIGAAGEAGADLDELVRDPARGAELLEFARAQHAEEGVLFCAEVLRLRAAAPSERARLAVAIYDQFLRAGAPAQLHAIPQVARRAMLGRLASLLDAEGATAPPRPPSLRAEAFVTDEQSVRELLGEVYARAANAASAAAAKVRVRIYLPAQFGGGHCTLVVAPTALAALLRAQAADATARRRALPSGATLALRVMGAAATPGAGDGQGAGFQLDLAATELSPEEAAAGAAATLANVFDEAQRRVAAVLRVSLLPKFLEHREHARAAAAAAASPAPPHASGVKR